MFAMQRVGDLALAAQRRMAGSLALLPLSSLERRADRVPKAAGLSLQTPSQIHTLRHQSCSWFLISTTLMTLLVDSVSLTTTTKCLIHVYCFPVHSVLFCLGATIYIYI